MNKAVERSNKLYEALKEYYDSDERLTKEDILLEAENHLDDIIKRYEVFSLDLTTLSSDIAGFVDEEFFKPYPDLFPRPDSCPYDARARLKMSDDYTKALDHLRRAIMETAKDR